MMEAVTEGVRSLLHLAGPAGAPKKSQWKEYVERFDHAINDDQELHDGIFGSEFARAYASVAVGDGAKPGSVKPGNDRGRPSAVVRRAAAWSVRCALALEDVVAHADLDRLPVDQDLSLHDRLLPRP